MGISVMLLILSGAAAYWQVPDMYRDGRRRELYIYLVVLAASTAFAILYAMHVPLPTPLDFLYVLFEPVSRMVNRLLGLEEI